MANRPGLNLFLVTLSIVWGHVGAAADFPSGSAPSASFTDSFNRPDGGDLGAAWRETLPDFEIAGNALRNATGDRHPRAAIWNQPVGPDQDVSVSCKVTAPENACGVMARYAGENNFYRARIDVGQQNLLLAKTVGGETTVLAKVSRAMQFDTYYRVRLIVEGTSLQVFFGEEPAPAIALEDASLASGGFAGIRGQASAARTNFFDDFLLITPGAPPPQTGANLILGLLAEPDQVAPGEALTYTMVVLNSGPDPAIGVTLTNILPEEATLLSAPESCHGARPVVCDLGRLNPEESALVTLTAAIPAAGTAAAVASVTAATADPDPASNRASISTLVAAAPLNAATPGAEGGEGSVAPSPPSAAVPPTDDNASGASAGGCAAGAGRDPTLAALLGAAVLRLALGGRGRGSAAGGAPRR